MSGTNVGTGYLEIVPSARGFAGRIQAELGGQMAAAGEKAGDDAAKGFGERFKSGLKRVATAGAALLAGGALMLGANIGKDAIAKASDLGETISKSNTIFAKNAAEIDSWSKTAASSMGLSRQEALAVAAGFGDMFSQIGFTGDQAADMSKSVVQMSADLGSFNNLPTADVTERISAAFRGEYDSLQALIPNINAARVEAEAMAKTGKKTAKELTAQEKAAAVLAIVNKDGARAMGDFSRTSGGLANQQKILSARVDDLKASIGEKLLPVATAIVSRLSDFVKGMQDGTGAGGAFAARASEIADKVRAFVAEFKDGTGAGGQLRTTLAAVGKVLAAVAGFLAGNIGLVTQFSGAIGVLVAGFKAFQILKTVTIAVQAFNVALAANPIGLVVIAIAALVAGLIYAYKNSETFRKVVDTAFKAIAAVARWLWNTIFVPFLKFLIGGFSTLMDWVAGLLDALGNVPGFGWAKDAANKMRGAAGKARELADNIRQIPGEKNVDVNVRTTFTYQGEKYLAGVIGGSVANAARRATGGPVRAGTAYLVGENEPELFVPGENGRILNGDQMAAAGTRGVLLAPESIVALARVLRAMPAPVMGVRQVSGALAMED